MSLGEVSYWKPFAVFILYFSADPAKGKDLFEIGNFLVLQVMFSGVKPEDNAEEDKEKRGKQAHPELIAAQGREQRGEQLTPIKDVVVDHGFKQPEADSKNNPDDDGGWSLFTHRW